MTVWAPRTFPMGQWGRVQDLFGTHFMALRGPHNMILVHADDEDWKRDKIILGLPDKTLLPMYESFEAITRDQLPRAATLLVGHVSSFEAQFDYKREVAEA